MRVVPLTVAALQLTALTGCAAGPETVAGDAGPAGSPPSLVSSSSVVPGAVPSATTTPVPASTTASSATPASAPASAPSPSRPSSAPATTAPAATGTIRTTDWANVTLADLWQYGDVTFSNGKGSSGANNCHTLPGGARPFYAEYLTEEPARAPVTEDALILVDCGSDMQQQALVPVKLGYDQKTRQTVGVIPADPPPGPDREMTFTSYRVEKGVIVTTVRKADGSAETRRYRYNGGINWERF